MVSLERDQDENNEFDSVVQRQTEEYCDDNLKAERVSCVTCGWSTMHSTVKTWVSYLQLSQLLRTAERLALVLIPREAQMSSGLDMHSWIGMP